MTSDDVSPRIHAMPGRVYRVAAGMYGPKPVASQRPEGNIPSAATMHQGPSSGKIVSLEINLSSLTTIKFTNNHKVSFQSLGDVLD